MGIAASHGKVLVIDDQYAEDEGNYYRRSDFLEDYGALPFDFVFSTAWDAQARRYTVEAAMKAVRQHRPDAVLLDVEFGKPGEGARVGLNILPELLNHAPHLPVVMMTYLEKEAVWQTSSRLGAVDYLPKPLDARFLWQTLDRYVCQQPKHWLVGQSPALLEVVIMAAQASEGGRTKVLIHGESGTGKEGMAHYISRHGPRAAKPLVPVPLAGLLPDRLQFELFGAKKGSFTGGTTDHVGYFEHADGGVIFLDEIGEIDKATQARLLRVAESGEIAPMGCAQPYTVDVQIVSATNASLSRLVKDGDFRPDLWARLRGTVITLPSLAQRREDIPLLVRHILRVEAIERKIAVPALPESVEARLMAWPWVGNVRGLVSYVSTLLDGTPSPTESDFLDALKRTPRADEETLDVDPPGSEVIHEVAAPVHASGTEREVADLTANPDGVQSLRYMELALLYRALIETSHPVTGAINRASAAARLKGRTKTSTNEFDNWVAPLWRRLDEAHRARAEMELPDLMPVIQEVLAGSAKRKKSS